MSVYRFISAEKARTPVSVCCELLGVSRSGDCEWLIRPPSERALSDAWLPEKLKEIHAARRGVYGARRVHAELRLALGVHVGKKRVERLMRQAGLSGLVRRRRGKTTIRVPGVRVADDLVERQFRPAAPDVLWAADITYLPTSEGWICPTAIQDAYSRRIVGCSLADHMRAELVVDALQMALARRRPGPGLIHHADQGTRFVSLAFGLAARDAGIAVSTGGRGDAYDSAVAESLVATLNNELIHGRSWPTRRELIGEVFEYIEAFYDPLRRRFTLGYLSPAEFENRTSNADGASLAASRLASTKIDLNQLRPNQPRPLKRGHSKPSARRVFAARPPASAPAPRAASGKSLFRQPRGEATASRRSGECARHRAKEQRWLPRMRLPSALDRAGAGQPNAGAFAVIRFCQRRFE